MTTAKGTDIGGDFRGKTEVHTFAGFLFDLDGTLIDTTDAITKHWEKYVHVLLDQK